MKQQEFLKSATANGIQLTVAQLNQFEVFEEALYRHNEVKNLTRIAREEAWIKHFIDALLVGTVIHELFGHYEFHVADLGTGPGIPAWPLACAFPNWKVTAIDSNGKMLEFLESQPLPNLHVLNARIEEIDMKEKFDVVTGRAVAPLPIQLELSAALIKLGGFCIPMRTPNDEIPTEPMKELGLTWSETRVIPLPETDIERVFPIYGKSAKTNKKYPRKWSEIKKAPLQLI